MLKSVSWTTTTQPYPVFTSSLISTKISSIGQLDTFVVTSSPVPVHNLMVHDHAHLYWNGSLASSDIINSEFGKSYDTGLVKSVEKEEEIEPLGLTSPTALILLFVLALVIVGTIIGNILVCVAVILVRKLRRPYNYLLVSLAVSDLCVAILVMPLAMVYEFLGEWKLGRTVCDIWVSFDVLSCTASILNLCMISVDRYLAITKPLEYGVKRTPKRMIAYIVFVWLGAAFISVPPVLILGNEHEDGRTCIVCQNFWYQIYATFGSFYIPLSVMVTVYYKIFKAAKRIVNEEKRAQAHLRPTEEDEQKAKLNNISTYTQQTPISRYVIF